MRKLILMVFGLSLMMSGIASAEIKAKMGGAERIRYEFWKNPFDLENSTLDNRSFFRFKTSLWGQVDFTPDASVYLKMTNENKPYTYWAPSASKASGKPEKNYRFDIHEVIVDNLYMDLKNVIGQPIDIRAGRQDLNYGEGFLISDGTPGDGSRSYYFNAFKTTYRIDENNSVDAIYVHNQRYDSIFQPIHEASPVQSLNTTTENGGILYVKSKPMDKLTFEPYYIYKREADGKGVTGYQSRDSRIHTVGQFAKYDLGWAALRGQLAGQIGSYGQNTDREALGGYLFLDKELKDMQYSPKLSGGYIYLSGDNPETTDVNEAWNPLFSRAPWTSDLLGMLYRNETGISFYWTNLEMFRLETILQLTSKTKFTARYNYAMADEKTATSLTLGDGHQRGHLPQVKLDYAFNKDVNFFVQAEYFSPRDFYNANADDVLFLRSEVSIKF